MCERSRREGGPRPAAIALLVLVVAAGAPSAVAGEVVRFTMDDPLARDLVQWTLAAPLERIVGTTGAVRGEITVDRGNLRSAETAARIVVDVARFATGIAIRDRHLRDEFLAAARFPEAVFTLERVASASADSLRANAPVELVVTGTLELHGVKRPLSAPVTLLYMAAPGPAARPSVPAKPGNLLLLTAEFEVLLADFGIGRRGMILQIGDTARVNVSLLATDAAAGELARARAEAEDAVRRETAKTPAGTEDGGR